MRFKNRHIRRFFEKPFNLLELFNISIIVINQWKINLKSHVMKIYFFMGFGVTKNFLWADLWFFG